MRKTKRFMALLAALMIAVSMCCTTAFAAPAEDDADEAETVTVQTEETENSRPYDKSYFIKAGVVIGAGVVIYIVLAAKTKKK